MYTNIHIDIETYSNVDLVQCGVYKYALDPSFDVLLFAWAADDEDVQIADCTTAKGQDQMRAVLEIIIKCSTVLAWAHNAQFERVCLTIIARRLGLIGRDEWLPADRWRCTMILSAMCGLPASLAQVGAVLDLTHKKMEEGKKLIQMFCKPHESSKLFSSLTTRVTPEETPEQWNTFMEYCKRDVEVERAIHHCCSWYINKNTAMDAEWRNYAIDQGINDYGVAVDLILTHSARALAGDNKPAVIAKMRAITGLANPVSNAQLKRWLSTRLGHNVYTLNKESIPAIIKEANTLGDDDIIEVLDLRATASKTSVSKYTRITNMVCDDGRLRGLLSFYGTRTGRWASKGVQLHNLPQNHLPMLDDARRLARSGDDVMLSLIYGDLMPVLSQLIRTVFVPTDNKTFIVCDFAAVEARILAWLAGETWVIKAFEANKDIYCETASMMFGVPVGKHGPNAELRQKGKVAVLALGYGGSIGALARMGGDRLGMTENEMTDIVKKWRATNKQIVSLWRAIEQSVIKVCTTGKSASVHLAGGQMLVVTYHPEADTVNITLPSGRLLSYRQMTYNGKEQTLSYMGLNQQTGVWGNISTHGGKLVENITQAVGRDLLANVIAQIDAAGLHIVLHVHDEVVVEADDPAAVIPVIEQIFAQGPAWADGLPLKGASYTGSYYYKD